MDVRSHTPHFITYLMFLIPSFILGVVIVGGGGGFGTVPASLADPYQPSTEKGL